MSDNWTRESLNRRRVARAAAEAKAEAARVAAEEKQEAVIDKAEQAYKDAISAGATTQEAKQAYEEVAGKKPPSTFLNHVRKFNRPERAKGVASTPKGSGGEGGHGEGGPVLFGRNAGSWGFKSKLSMFGSGGKVGFSSKNNLFGNSVGVKWSEPFGMG